MKKDILDCIKEGKKAKEYRQLMGIKQIDMAKLLEVPQANLCHMETGRFNLGDRYTVIQSMFEKWRIVETLRLEEHIQYLKSL